jgi:hypothetical protein
VWFFVLFLGQNEEEKGSKNARKENGERRYLSPLFDVVRPVLPQGEVEDEKHRVEEYSSLSEESREHK